MLAGVGEMSLASRDQSFMATVVVAGALIGMNVGMNATFQSRLVRRVPRNSTEQGLKAGKVG